MKPLMNFRTLVQLRLSLRAIYVLHELLNDSDDQQIYTELLYEKIHTELDKFTFRTYSPLITDHLEIFVLIVRLLNHRLEFDLFLSMFVMNIYELECSIIYKNRTLNKVRLLNEE